MSGSAPHTRSYGRMAISALLIFCLMAVLVFGASVYRDAVAVQSARDERCLVQAALATRLYAGDRAGAISMRSETVGDVLVLSEQSDEGSFETRIFSKGGSLIEDYVPAQAPFDADGGTAIGSTETFDVSIDGPLITLTTDEGEQYFTMRGTGGDAA